MDAAKLSFGFKKSGRRTGRQLLLADSRRAPRACEPLDITRRVERPRKAAPRGLSAEKGGKAFLFLREYRWRKADKLKTEKLKL